MSEDTAIAERPTQVSLGTLQADDSAGLVAGATDIANQLAGVIKKQKLWVRIGPKDYVRVEGWSTLCALMGVMPQEVSNTKTEDDSYVATVELVRMSDGVVISRASAECGMDENRWSKMPRYARRSMAATRATGKAARLAFGWVMALSGYESTPLEEMDCVTAEPKPSVPFEEPPLQQDLPRDADAEFGTWKGRLRSVDKSEGEGARGPWTRYALKCPDSPDFSTFDTKLGETAEALVGEPVEIGWQKKGKYYNLVDIFPAEGA